jgi:putative intracellular protease/amidase
MTEKKYELEVFSPNGGVCVADGMSDPRDASGYSAEDLISLGCVSSPKHAGLIEKTKKVSEVEIGKFDAILVAGGQSPMFTFESAHDLHKKFVEFHDAGKVTVALCHGVATLRYAKLSNGPYSRRARPSPASPTSRRTSPTTRSGR